jgi:hypothetical protein
MVQKLWGFKFLAEVKLPKTAKIYLETISSRNFEIPPKIEILVSFQKKNFHV